MSVQMRPYVSEFWRSYKSPRIAPPPPAAETLRELDEAFWDRVQEELRVLRDARTTAPRAAHARARLELLGVVHGC